MHADDLILYAVREVGTPLYLYDWAVVENRLSRIRAAMPNFEVFYAMKANSWDHLAARMGPLVDGFDVSAAPELLSVLGCGVPPASVTYTGPGKTTSDLESIAKTGVVLDVDSIGEIERFSTIARTLQKRVSVTLRVNSSWRPPLAGEYMAGGPSQFGIDEEQLNYAWDLADRSGLHVSGIHAHVASQVLDVRSIASHIEHLENVAVALESDGKRKCAVLNFGGGFGIPYAPGQPELNLTELNRLVSGSQTYTKIDAPQRRRQLALGRYLVAEAGSFVTRVVDVKYSRGRRFVICESGISGFSRPAMPWAQQHRCRVVSAAGDQPTSTTVVGRTCLPADVLAQDAMIGAVKAGDLIEIENAGAYGRTMTLLHWGSLAEPAEVLIDSRTDDVLAARSAGGRDSAG